MISNPKTKDSPAIMCLKDFMWMIKSFIVVFAGPLIALILIVVATLWFCITPQDEAVEEISTITAELTSEGWTVTQNKNEIETCWNETEKVVHQYSKNQDLRKSLSDMVVLSKENKYDVVFYIENSCLGRHSFDVQQVIYTKIEDQLEYDTWYYK